MSAIPSLFPALNPAPVLPGLKNAILPAMPTFQPPPGPAPVVPDYQPAPPPDAFQRHLAVLNQPRPQPPAMYGLGQSGGLAQMGLPAAPALGEQPRLPDRRRAPRLDPEDPETYAKLRPAVLKAAETSSGWDDFLGALGRILDVVDIPRMWVNQAIAAVLGIKGSSPDKALTGGQRVYGSDVMRHMGVESRWGQLLGGFVWDVVTDPLSWVAGIGKAAKAVGKVAVGGKTHTMLRPIAKEARKLIGGGKYGSAIKALSDVAGIPMHPATLTKLTAAAEAVGKGDDLARMLAKTARGAGETAIEWERRVRGLGTDVAGLLDDVAKAGAKGSPLRAKGQAALGELFSEVVEKGGLGRAGGMRLSTEPLRHFPLLGTGISWRGKQIVPGLKHILPAMGPEQGLRLAAPGALALSPRVAGGIAGALVGAGVAPEDHPFAGMLTGAALGALAGPKLGRWAVESGHIASQGRSIGQGRGILGAIKQDLAKKFGRGGSLALRRSKSIQQAWGRASEAASRADLKGAPLNAARELKAFRLRFNKLTGFVLSKEETEKVARLFTSARELADLRPDDMLDVMAGVMTDTAMGRLGGAEVREVLSAKLVPGAARDVMLGAPELSAGVRRFGVFPDPQGKNWVVIEAVKDADDAIKRAPNQTARYRRVASRNSADDAIEWAMAHGADRNGVEGHVMLEWDDNGRLVSPAAGGEPMPPGQDLGFRGEIPQQTARQAAPAVETPPVPEAAPAGPAAVAAPAEIGPLTRGNLVDRIKQAAPHLDDDVVRADAAILEANAQAWASKTGRPAEEYFQTYFREGGVVKGSGSDAARVAGASDDLAAIFDQAGAQGVPAARGAVDFDEQGRALIRLFEAADASTFPHEAMHVMRRVAADVFPDELRAVEAWAGVKVPGQWTREAEEKLARAFENYLATGRAPTKNLRSAFASFKEWLKRVYARWVGRGSPLTMKRSPEVNDLFHRLLGEDPKYGLGVQRAKRTLNAERNSLHASLAGHADELGQREMTGAEQIRLRLHNAGLDETEFSTIFRDRIPGEYNDILRGHPNEKFLRRHIRAVKPGDPLYASARTSEEALGAVGAQDVIDSILERRGGGAFKPLDDDTLKVLRAYGKSQDQPDVIRMIDRYEELADPSVVEDAARQTAAGELVRPAEEAAVATSVDDAILSALENTTTDFRQPSGGLASLRDARMSLGMTKKEFDDAIIRMANEKKIILHKYAFPFGQSQETGWEYLVKDPGAEQWYGGAVLGDSPEARAYASRGSSAATQRPTLAPATGIPLGPNDEPLSRAGLFGEDVPGAPIGRKQRKLGLDMEDARIQKAAVGETQIGDDLARRAVALVARKGGPTTERELVEALMDEKGWQTLFRDASNPMPEAREAFLQASKGKSLFASGPPMPAKGMLFQLADGDVDPVLWENLHLDRTMDPAMQRLVNRAQARMTAMGAKELEAGALGAFMQSAKVGYIPHYPTVEEARKQESLLGAIKRGIRKKQTFQHMRRLRDQSIEELHESIRRSGGRTFSYRTNPLEYETIRQMEHSHAMGNAFMLEEIMDTVGEKLAKGKPVKDGWARLTGMKTGYFKPFEDRIVPRDVADYLRGVDRMWERPGAMARAFDQALGTMKGWMLIAPAYHIRNAISNLWLLMSGEAFGLSSVDDGYRALKAVRVGSAKKFGKALARTLNPDTGNPYTWKEVVDELDAMGVLKRTLFDEPLSGIVSDVLQGAKPKKAWKQALNPLEWSELNRRVGGYIEDGAKVSGVIERLRRGDTIQQAAARVQRFLFDYTDLTHFERTTMRRLFPFYSWAKNNFLLQMDLLLERPEITAILPKLKGNIETSLPPGEVVPSALRPSYVRKEAGTQLGGGLKPTYMNLPNILPISELKYATPGGAVRGAMDLLNPLIKQPVEHALNKDFFFDKPIQNYPGETTNVAGMELPPHIAHSITMIRPLSEVNRIAYGIRRGERPSSILGRVTGMRTFEGNLPREIAAYQRRQAETRGYMRAHAKIAIANGDLGKAEKIAATFEDNHMPEDATKVRIMLAEAQQDYQAAAAMAKQLAALQRERRQTQPSQTTVRELATAVSQR